MINTHKPAIQAHQTGGLKTTTATQLTPCMHYSCARLFQFPQQGPAGTSLHSMLNRV